MAVGEDGVIVPKGAKLEAIIGVTLTRAEDGGSWEGELSCTWVAGWPVGVEYLVAMVCAVDVARLYALVEG